MSCQQLITNSPQLVELKNGETYNGHMIACDNFMNITLRDVILTAPDGDKFYQMKEVYLKGNVVSALPLYLAGWCIIRVVGMGIPMKRENGLECWSVLGILSMDVANRRTQASPRWRRSGCRTLYARTRKTGRASLAHSLPRCSRESGEKKQAGFAA